MQPPRRRAPIAASASQRFCLLLLLLVCTLFDARTLNVQAHSDVPTPTQPAMRVQINADGTASVVPAGPGLPPGVILPGAGGDGLVPLWMVERDRIAREQQEREQAEKEAMREQERKRVEEEAATAAAVAEAAAQAEAEAEAKRRREEEEAAAEASRQAQRAADIRAEEAAELDDEVAAMLGRSSGSSPSSEQRTQQQREADDDAAAAAERARQAELEWHRQAAAEHAARQREEQQQQQQSEEAEAATSERQIAADEIAAAAARAYAEQQQQQQTSQQDPQQQSSQGLVVPDSAESHQVSVADPAQALLDSLHRAAFFRELLPHNAWSFVQQGRPFLILLVCRCELDDDLDLPDLENLMMDLGLHHRFSLLWAQAPTTHQFNMGHTYGLDLSRGPAIVIDNIPIGQHVEKYIFESARLARPRTATPAQIIQFMQDFLRAPSNLPLILRSSRPTAPAAASAASSSADPSSSSQGVDLELAPPIARGKVLEVFGDNFESVVLGSDGPVLLLLYSPTCPACHSALGVLEDLAQKLAWGSGSISEVLVAKLDRTANDLPFVLRFASYPAIFLFGAGSADGGEPLVVSKSFDSTADQGEEPQNRGLKGSRGWRAPVAYNAAAVRAAGDNSCNAPLNAQDLEEFVRSNIDGAAASAAAARTKMLGSQAPEVANAGQPQSNLQDDPTTAGGATDSDARTSDSSSTQSTQSTQQAGLAI